MKFGGCLGLVSLVGLNFPLDNYIDLDTNQFLVSMFVLV